MDNIAAVGNLNIRSEPISPVNRGQNQEKPVLSGQNGEGAGPDVVADFSRQSLETTRPVSGAEASENPPPSEDSLSAASQKGPGVYPNGDVGGHVDVFV